MWPNRFALLTLRRCSEEILSFLWLANPTLAPLCRSGVWNRSRWATCPLATTLTSEIQSVGHLLHGCSCWGLILGSLALAPHLAPIT